MASYEDDHNLPANTILTTHSPAPPNTSSTAATPSDLETGHRTRLNLTEFFAALDLNSNSSIAGTQPDPSAYTTLAAAFSEQLTLTPLLSDLIHHLRDSASIITGGAGINPNHHQPRGMPQNYTDSLERLSKHQLSASQTCPICNTPFLEDKYPLVVRLPCHTSHVFDLECIQPWLRVERTCPLDRVDLVELGEKRKRELEEMVKKVEEEEEEEEWDDNYG